MARGAGFGLGTSLRRKGVTARGSLPAAGCFEDPLLGVPVQWGVRAVKLEADAPLLCQNK